MPFAVLMLALFGVLVVLGLLGLTWAPGMAVLVIGGWLLLRRPRRSPAAERAAERRPALRVGGVRVIVPVASVDGRTAEALELACSLGDRVTAVNVTGRSDEAAARTLRAAWCERYPTVELTQIWDEHLAWDAAIVEYVGAVREPETVVVLGAAPTEPSFADCSIRHLPVEPAPLDLPMSAFDVRTVALLSRTEEVPQS